MLFRSGTNMPEITSAKRPIEGLEFCARLTILIIFAKVVSLPIWVALNNKDGWSNS